MRNQDENMIRWSEKSKPSIGGISFYIIFLISFIVYIFWSPENYNELGKSEIGFLVSASIGFIMGLSDDAYNTRPLMKFGFQVICAIILIYCDLAITTFDSNILNYAFTIFWVVAVMNSINMLDNMDAITTSTSIFILLAALICGLAMGHLDGFFTFSLIGVLSALVGFLYYNWHPSKMFMGDTGSQFLGVLLSVIGIKYFWNYQDIHGIAFSSQQLIIVMLAFIVPISDTSTVIINRLSRKQSPFVGGKDHTTHHLSYLGFSDQQVALILGGISLLSCIAIFFILNYIKAWTIGHFAFFLGWILVIFTLLFTTTKAKKARTRFNEQEQLLALKKNGN